MFDIVRFKGDLERLLNRYIAGGPVEDYREMADFLRDVGDQIDHRADEIKAGPRTAGRTGRWSSSRNRRRHSGDRSISFPSSRR